MEAFAKSDDERDFYLDRVEGFLVYVDLDKTQQELDELLKEFSENKSRYIPIPKLTFYEVKKLMESFVNEKVYDIDTKEKLLDIIQSREARENFLEFIYDHHAELEKWQQYYQERFRIRIIEWLRNQAVDFVFEEDVELTKSIVEKVKMNMFTPKVAKDIMQARKLLAAKAATYYSNEALNPRPKRGRPPKQVAKVETEPQFSQDIYVTVPKGVKPFLFTPDYHSSSMIFTFSGKFASEADLLAHRKQMLQSNLDLQTLSQKLAALRTLSANWNRDDETSSSFTDTLTSDIEETKKNRQKELKMAEEEAEFVVPTKEKPTKPSPKALPKATVKKPEKSLPKPVAKSMIKPATKPAMKPAAKPQGKSPAKVVKPSKIMPKAMQSKSVKKSSKKK
jgi:hypothetical protein